jgi:opacity protein-like surface antigen
MRRKEMKIRSALVLGLVLLFGSAAFAQDYPKIETSPAFMYIRTSGSLSNAFIVNGQVVTNVPSLNCAGGGGTIAYNVSSVVGIAADLGGCKIFSNAYGLGNTVDGSLFTFLFGPRFTYRNSSKFEPFFEVNFGGVRAALSCQSQALNCLSVAGSGTYSKVAFGMTVGGGFQIKMSKKISLRLVQAEYLYTRFGNSCAAVACTWNNNQNSFRLKSGIVLNW